MDRKHNHAEAFCHMLYQSNDPKKLIRLMIYNSRDGVTPFCLQSKEFGVELQHTNFPADRYDPTYQPRAGDLVWRDATDDDKQAWFEAKKEMLRTIADPATKPMAEHVLKMYEEDPATFFEEIEDGTPVLQLISE